MMKRLIFLILALILLCSTSLAAGGEDPEGVYYNQFIPANLQMVGYFSTNGTDLAEEGRYFIMICNDLSFTIGNGTTTLYGWVKTLPRETGTRPAPPCSSWPMIRSSPCTATIS